MSVGITYILNEISLCRRVSDGRADVYHATPSVEALLGILSLVRELRSSLDRVEAEAIAEARKLNARWSDLAGPLGVRSRAAAERRASRIRDRVADAKDGLSALLYQSETGKSA